MPQTKKENKQYVGYLNDVDLFVEAMYDEERNPNGIGKIKLCVDSSSIIGKGDNGLSEFYREIFGLNSQVSSSYRTGSFSNSSELGFLDFVAGGHNITKTIKFIINEDIQFGGGNKWDDSIQKLIDGAYGKSTSSMLASKFGGKLGGESPSTLGSLGASLGAAKNIAGVAKEILNGTLAATGTKFQTLMQTIKFWEGSNEPGPFRFNFNLLATNPEIDIRRDLLALYASVYPVSITDAYQSAASRISASAGRISSGLKTLIGGGISDGLDQILSGAAAGFNNSKDYLLSGFMSAPLGYSPVDGYISSLYPTTKEGSGLIDLRIGKWLHIPNLVMESFSATISKVTTRYGFPLYAKCSLQLKPVRMWTITDIYDAFFSSGGNGKVDYVTDSNGKKIYNTSGKLDSGEITKVKLGSMP